MPAWWRTSRATAALYGFDEWSTPVFEDTRVFSRTLGDTSDVVTKEMYSFDDRGGDSVTLRPEGTAGICRALVTNGLTQSLPQKVFYAGPMFRYERPQKGRYRQFHQIGAELIGPAEPLADAEVIACGWDILSRLGIAADTVLEVNTLGDRPSRDAYRTALVGYFSEHRDALSSESRDRLERNPLRILDSQGPRPTGWSWRTRPPSRPPLSAEAAAFYAGVLEQLGRFGVPFRENPRIVRGLDYYNHTAFEFVTTRLGAQGTVMAGGRYDGPGGADGRPAHARGRLGRRDRAAVHAAGRCRGRAGRRRRHPGGRGGGGSGDRRAAAAAAGRGAGRDGISRQPEAPHGTRQPDRRPRRDHPRCRGSGTRRGAAEAAWTPACRRRWRSKASPPGCGELARRQAGPGGRPGGGTARPTDRRADRRHLRPVIRASCRSWNRSSPASATCGRRSGPRRRRRQCWPIRR